MAELYFTHGPMGSQKTVRLLADAYDYEQHGGKVLVTKPAADTKGDDKIVSRIGISPRAVDFLATPDMDVQAEVLRRRAEMERLSALMVDEAQFLQPEQVDQLLALAVVNAIPVKAYGLRTDFQTHAFPGSLRLLEVAHVLQETATVCGHGDDCGRQALFNARKIGGLFVATGDQVAIDGEAEVTYTSLCADHYRQDVGTPTAAFTM